ncbi:response regulator [candidate division KSB3 bacterium]|jgi:twitching motility two-component system response regulator PilH|uniref:Response regulator n=1 Tax=candidate division KSB3 bacterium TaxID=2044937 RepID=A0A9D5JVL2_9BACT|nr:response regulator [candidate division KSB3 bacterium]MBD3324727.1 response regulator [candidate division KSB3 bacterium]
MAKVLIVDDSLFQRRIIRRILQKAQHDVEEASSGQQGLEMVRSVAPDCIILDILMPDVDGLSFLKTLQDQGDTTPVIVLTADIQETTRQECIAYGAKEVLHKPLAPGDSDTLRHLIHDILQS